MAQAQVRSKEEIVKAAQQAVDTLIALCEYAEQEHENNTPVAECRAMLEMCSVSAQLAESFTLDEMLQYIRVGAEDNGVECSSIPSPCTIEEIAFKTHEVVVGAEA